MKYSATFSNGTTIKRKSDRVYTHVWLVTFNVENRTLSIKGFASSLANAEKAVRAAIPAKSLASGYATNVMTYVTGVTRTP